MSPLLFNQPFFLFVFLPTSLFIFYLVGKIRSPDASSLVLLILSIVFYYYFGLDFLVLLLCSITINFCVGYFLAIQENRRTWIRRSTMFFGIGWNLGTLAWFKYLGYFEFLWSGDGAPTATFSDFAIPAGISFYTFHQLTFLADAYRRKPEVIEYLGLHDARPLRSFLRYGAFICFFPQLVIGPITYLSEFAASTAARRFGQLRRIDVEIGLTFIVLGLFKKICIADNLAPISQAAFTATANGQVVDPLIAWSGATAYFFQLYFDFSGYTDIAIGLARLFGIRLPINFDSPLRASGIRDFYARWHMTLTRVIVRFLFTPLTLWGTRRTMRWQPRNPARRALAIWLPLLANFQVIALWHGALGTFALFGLVHGLWAILETEWFGSKWWRKWSSQFPAARLRALGRIMTILPLMLTFALFGSANLAAFGLLLQSMFLFPTDPATGLVGLYSLRYIVIAAAIVWLLPNSAEFLRHYRPAILTRKNPSTTPTMLRVAWRPTVAWSLALIVLFIASIYYMANRSPFLYQGF